MFSTLPKTNLNLVKRQKTYSPVFLNPIPVDKISDWSKLKSVADSNLNVVQIIISVFDIVQNIVDKEESASYQHFLLFPQCLLQVFLSRTFVKTFDF